jgi:hypothetical protein
VQTFQKLRRWLNLCTQSHGECKRTLISWESDKTLPPRVIDVGSRESEVRLVETGGDDGQYLVLSYCWGSLFGGVITTTKKNIDEFTKFLPVRTLPRTIQDAIVVTRELGFKFLWVDSLCIIQDESKEWEAAVQTMGDIYQRAVCTISATGAKDCSEGLFLPRSLDDGSPGSLSEFQARVPCSVEGRVIGDMFISPALQQFRYGDSDFSEEIRSSPWAHRAWVFQERFLSRRIIHFAKQQVYWECQRLVRSDTEIDGHHFNTDVREENWKRLTLSLARSNEANKIWRDIIQRYSLTKLTFDKDRLLAIEGIAREMASLVMSDYCAGMFLTNIARALFWAASSSTDPLRKPTVSRG